MIGMPIYTKTGDKGKTSVIGGIVDKDDIRVEAYGTIDELNTFVGQARSLLQEQPSFSDLAQHLLQIQHELFDCGSDLAYISLESSRYKVTSSLVERLEHWIDTYEQQNTTLEKFILPGGTLLASSLHVCRTVCRRAERRVVTLGREVSINPAIVQYMNRLSDFFFVVARIANVRSNVQDMEYERSGKVFSNNS